MAASPVRIDVRSDIQRAVVEFRRAETNVTTATVRALNRALDTLRTETGREVRKVYNVKLQAVRKVTRLRRAHAKSLFARMIIEGARIPLIEFAARAVNPWNVKGRKRKPGGGVSVQVKVGGGRKLVRSAFITAATANNAKGGGSEGMLQVWRRRSAERESMQSLRSLSIPQAVSNRAVMKALETAAMAAFTKNFEQQLRYQSGGARG